jgi:hypothetical protein
VEVRTWIPFPRLRVRATEQDDHTYFVEIWQQDRNGSWPPKWDSYLVVRTGDLHKILEEEDT